MKVLLAAFLCVTAVSAASKDTIISKLGSHLRFNYIQDENGKAHLSDSWIKIIDVNDLPIYVPSRDNVYHLFTRQNPSVSQPILFENDAYLSQTNFNGNRPTVFLIHGYQGSAVSNFNTVLIPAYLAAADVNIILVDWSRGANSGAIVSAIYASMSTKHVARFSKWLSEASGQSLADFTLVGVGLGGLKAGVIGRRLDGEVGYIAALDPSMGIRLHEVVPRIRPNDAIYTEVVHTNVGNLGYIKPMAQVDIYPNGGINMAGCGRNDECDRDRSFFYWAESLTSGGFTSRKCVDWEQALEEECEGETIQMGGLTPKTGSTGVYSVQTNAGPPFSQG